jgi:hypothetical protein
MRKILEDFLNQIKSLGGDSRTLVLSAQLLFRK